jgi:hypothetical protein
MAIDIDQLLYDMHPALKEYCEIPQLLQAAQDLDQRVELVYPRIIINPSLPYGQDDYGEIVSHETVPSEEEEEFDYDIIVSHYSNPRVTLSINGYGNNQKPVRTYIQKAQEWFRISELGKRFFDEYGNIVVYSVFDIEDRTEFLEANYEQRLGFDVILQFSEKVQVREKTIEQIEITNKETEESQVIDI